MRRPLVGSALAAVEALLVRRPLAGSVLVAVEALLAPLGLPGAVPVPAAPVVLVVPVVYLLYWRRGLYLWDWLYWRWGLL